MKRIHSLLNTGRNEVVDGDLSNYFGEIPHATSEEHCPTRERRTNARTHQGVAGNAGGGGRRQGRHQPHEPRLQGTEGNPARGADLALETVKVLSRASIETLTGLFDESGW